MYGYSAIKDKDKWFSNLRTCVYVVDHKSLNCWLMKGVRCLFERMAIIMLDARECQR